MNTPTSKFVSLKLKAPLYLEQVNSALAELQEITQVQSTQLVNMGVSALEVFGKANTIITGIAAQKQLLEKQLKVPYYMSRS